MKIYEKILQIDGRRHIENKWFPLIENMASKTKSYHVRENSIFTTSLCYYMEYLSMTDRQDLAYLLNETLSIFLSKINNFNFEIESECLNIILNTKVFKFTNGKYSTEYDINECEFEIIFDIYEPEFLSWWMGDVYSEIGCLPKHTN